MDPTHPANLQRPDGTVEAETDVDFEKYDDEEADWEDDYNHNYDDNDADAFTCSQAGCPNPYAVELGDLCYECWNECN